MVDFVYQVVVVNKGWKEKLFKEVFVWWENVLEVLFNKLEGGIMLDGKLYMYSVNDVSVGDVDGDGEYEIILKWDLFNVKDNVYDGYIGEVFIDVYKLDGIFLWCINFGKNIRVGVYYIQFMVYDLDGDGKVEIVMKIVDGIIDGKGYIIGDEYVDYRNEQGRILFGLEYLIVFKGEIGEVFMIVEYELFCGKLEDWGDGYGNCMDCFFVGIVYLDGEWLSFVMVCGYYMRVVFVVYDFRNGRFKKCWIFDFNQLGYEVYVGQGNYSLSVVDVDGDGKDEIIYGVMVVDYDGIGLYIMGFGYGDVMYVGDLDLFCKGFEVFQVYEDVLKLYGLLLCDVGIGEILWGVYVGIDVGRGMVVYIDLNYKGLFVWGIDLSGNDGMLYGFFISKGEKISDKVFVLVNFVIWWDGDLVRELFDYDWDGMVGRLKIEKWDVENCCLKMIFQLDGVLFNNGIKGNFVFQVNLFGDWWEEVIWRMEDSSVFCIYIMIYFICYCFYMFMYDLVYRFGIVWQNIVYNQLLYMGFYFGMGMKKLLKFVLYIVGSKVEVLLQEELRDKK